MAKISEVVTLKTGYANFVDLKNDFEESQKNAGRMAMYRPTKAHRVAFERICRGLYQPNDKKFYLLSGSFGTGKSHLCLMSANVLSRSSGDPEISPFHDTYSKLSPDSAKILRNIRKDGQFLVAICDYHSGKNFEDVVLKAVFEACKARGLDAEIETEFDEAERQLEDWQSRAEKDDIRNFYEDFGKALETVAPGLSIEQCRVGLRNFESNYLEKFKSAFKIMMGGVDFSFKSGNLIPIVQKLVRSKAFKDRFKGLAIFFDEFGFTLENKSYSKDILQGFMETICKKEPNVMFIGCIHKDFKAYADRFSKDDAAVMTARMTQVDLLNEGLEEIISSIVETNPGSETWTREVKPKTGVFDQLLPSCKTLNLFPWIEDLTRVREKVLEDIYGVHPMALSCLLNLSSEIGSDARSTFTFFSGDVGGQPGSYVSFIENSDITINGGKLNLYTVDQLFSFFSSELSQKNPDLREQQRQKVNGYYASLEALRKGFEGELRGLQDDERTRVLKTILIYQLCQISTTLENIQFGLYALSSSEKTQVEGFLKDLEKKGAIYMRQQSKTYELAASGGDDPYELIERYVSNPKNNPDNIVAAFMDETDSKKQHEYIAAKNHNLPFSEDKRLRTRFVLAKDLGEPLWKEIKEEYLTNLYKPASSFEGTLVFALCENEGDINTAKESIKNISDDNIAVAIPHSPKEFSEVLLKVKACRNYLPPNEAEKLSAQTESRLRDILENTADGYLLKLQRVFRSYVESADSCWYAKAGKVLIDKPKQPHKPADMICEGLFEKRCHIKHPDLNLCYDDKWRSQKNTALKQAVTVLLEADKVFIDNGNPDNHGEKRYLEKVLLKGAGALRKTGSEGTITYFECESDSKKVHTDFQLLKELCIRLENLTAGDSFPIGSFIENARKSPYGAGGTPLILSLAHILRAYGERLIVYKDSTATSEQHLSTYDDLVSLVSDFSSKTVFVVREISPAQQKLVESTAKAVDAPQLLHGEKRSLSSAIEALQEWWKHLADVSKIIDLYEKEKHTRIHKLKSLFNDLSGSSDKFDFLFRSLPLVYSIESDGASITEEEADEVITNFSNDVKLLESGEVFAQNLVANSICEVFGTEGDLIKCEQTIDSWYKSLSSRQREAYKYENEDARQFLIIMANQDTSFSTKLLSDIPRALGFGTVPEWTSLHIKDYASKFSQVKREIEKAKLVIQKPEIEEGIHEVADSQVLSVNIPNGAHLILYTTDGSDPTKSETRKRSDKALDLVKLLKGRAQVKIKMCAVDEDGNKSDIVSVELISKERKYKIQIEENLFGVEDASFKCPYDLEGYISVVKSIVDYGLSRKFISKEDAETLKDAINRIQKK